MPSQVHRQPDVLRGHTERLQLVTRDIGFVWVCAPKRGACATPANAKGRKGNYDFKENITHSTHKQTKWGEVGVGAAQKLAKQTNDKIFSP